METSTLPLPDKTRCARCGQIDSPNEPLRRCSKCRATPYCSVECQKADWRLHKLLCPQYLTNKSLDDVGVYFGEKDPQNKRKGAKRTRTDILNDLGEWADSHNGDTLTISAWDLLELTRDITRATTHFLALTLDRTVSTHSRTYYELVDVDVLPMTLMDDVYFHYGGLNSEPISAREMLEQDAKRRKSDGALGSVLVISIELPKGDKRSPRDALNKPESSIYIMQPLGLFDLHRGSLARLPHLSKIDYIKCLDNGLRGGRYNTVFHPYVPL